jgi:hypothetical protein
LLLLLVAALQLGASFHRHDRLMEKEFKIDPAFKAWGPFIGHGYENEPITTSDVAIASVVWGLTLLCVLLAIYLGIDQTRSSRSPLRSVYVWLIWLELLVSFLMGIECYLHLLKYIKPSMSYEYEESE